MEYTIRTPDDRSCSLEFAMEQDFGEMANQGWLLITQSVVRADDGYFVAYVVYGRAKLK